jgi:hypothetical protein
MADQNAVTIAIAEETTFGVAPVTGSLYKYMRFNSEGFRFAGNSVQSGELDSNRQAQGQSRVSVNAEGSLNVEVSLRPPTTTYADSGFDSLIEGVCMNTWSDPADIGDVNLDLEIETATASSFYVVQKTGTDAFTNAVVGQWIKVSGFAQNGTVYGFITSIVDGQIVQCTGCRSTGAQVTDETAASDIDLAGSYIRAGSTKRSYAVQKHFTDWTTTEYAHGSGLRIGQLEFGVTNEAILTMAFTFLGKILATSTQNTITSSPSSIAAKWATTKLNASSHVPLRFEGSFNQDGVRGSGASNAPRMTSLTFTLGNGLATQPEIGAGLSGPNDITLANPTVEGGLEIYAENGVIMRKAEADTPSKIAWLIDDTVNDVQLMISFPNINYRPTVNADAGSQSAPLTGTFEWDGSPDPTNSVTIQFDRF